MDRGPFLRVRRWLIRVGVASRETTEDELDERAGYLIEACSTVDRLVRPALTADGVGRDLSQSDVIRRLAEVAATAEERRPDGHD